MRFAEACSPRSRSTRAVEGLVFGVLAGALAGGILYGAARFSFGKDDKLPQQLGLGIFGLSVIAGPILGAVEPTC